MNHSHSQHLEQAFELERLKIVAAGGGRAAIVLTVLALVNWFSFQQSTLTADANTAFALLFTATVLVRYSILWNFKQHAERSRAVVSTKHWYLIATICCGVVWGSWILCARSLPQNIQMLTYSLVGATAFVSLATLSAFGRAYLGLCLPPVLGLVASGIFNESPGGLPMVLMAVSLFLFALHMLQRLRTVTDASIANKIRRLAIQSQQAKMFESNRTAILSTSKTQLLRISGPAAQLLGVGKYPVILDLRQGLKVLPKHWDRLIDRVQNIITRDGMLSTSLRFVRPDGLTIWVDLQACMMDPLNPAAGIMWTLSDATKKRSIEERNEWLASHDNLTGAWNRAWFEQRLKLLSNQTVGGRTTQCFSLLSMDLDGFKAVNDQHGHAVGDAVLKIVAQRMKRALRDSDLLARVGGDEFLVLLESTPLKHQALIVSEKMIEAISQPITIDDRVISIGVSIGVAVWPTDSDNPDSLLRIADSGMYTTKQMGRNAYRRALTGFV